MVPIVDAPAGLALSWGVLRLLALVALLPGHGPQGRNPRRGADPNELPPVARVALRNFDAWDHDHDGALSQAEVDKAALSPWWHGEDAAALAALHIFLAAAKETAPRLTRDFFSTYRPSRLSISRDADPAEAKKLRRAYAATPASLQSEYALDLRRLTKPGATNLFAGDGPSLADVRQGQMGDCYLIAPIGAFVHRDPAAVSGMFHSDGSGSFTVAFANGKTITVARPTDAEIAMGGSSTTNGLWVRIVEKAYGSLDFAAEDAEARLARETTNHGGNPAKAGTLLTGHRFSNVRLVGGYLKEISDTDLAPKLERLRHDLPAAFAERRLVLADTVDVPAPPGVSRGHAYAVFGFDPATDTVTVWNPHADDFEPKGPEGLENGFRKKAGLFNVPLPLFVRCFSIVFIEQNSAPHPAH